MGRRLSLLAAAILLLFAVVVGQSMNLQFFRAKALDASPINPRNNTVSANQARGEIVAADGTILAQSVPSASGGYQRIYPDVDSACWPRPSSCSSRWSWARA